MVFNLGKIAFLWLRKSSGSKVSKNPIFRSGCLYPLLGFLLIYVLYVFLWLKGYYD